MPFSKTYHDFKKIYILQRFENQTTRNFKQKLIKNQR